jgi:tritrans,polycis-undecaprenyl-diphosphate synthase [geranylgeranyl-diphosphate specific]
MPIQRKISKAFQKTLRFFVENKLTLKFYEWYLWNQIKTEKIPGHVGVILDGNRRWAAMHGLEAWMGHAEGAKKVEDFLDWCHEIGKIKATTIYVLSTENFSRAPEELKKIMHLAEKYFTDLLNDPRIHRYKIKVKAIGRIETLPPTLQQSIKAVEEATKNYDQYYFNIAIAYGGRTEIVDAVKQIASDVKKGNLSPQDLDEKTIESRLYTHFLPNPYPDLIIRTSGEERLSNFLLWQSAYSELCFLDVYWPAFRKIDLLRAIRVYQQRQRRFGV